jgi:uncharacterized protein YbjT (DUF2867 family)
MSMKILVTGAAGTVGSEVVRRLCERGVRPVAAVHSESRAAAVDARAAEVRVADLGDPDQLEELFEGIDKVFLIAPKSPELVLIGDEIVAAADDAGVDHVVQLSIMGADARSGMRYTRWHGQIEKLLEETGMRWTSLRPNAFMQNFCSSWGGAIGPESKILLPLGDAAVSFIDARDVAAAGVEALLGDGHDGWAYTLTGAAAHTGTELAELFTRVLGRPVAYEPLTEEVARQDLEAAGVEEPLLTAQLEMWSVERAGDAAQVTAVVEDLTGRPPGSFEQFIGDNAGAWGGGKAATGDRKAVATGDGTAAAGAAGAEA